MRKHVLAAVAVAAAILVPGAALAAQPAVPGSLWNVGAGAAPVCRTVSVPPAGPAGEDPVLIGRPGEPDQFCGAYAQVGPAGTLQLPGGIPGERLSPAAYAARTGSTVTVAYAPDGRTVVYLSS